MVKRGIIILCIVIAFLMSVLAVQGQEQRIVAGVWSQPQFIGDGWWQQLAVDREDRVHLTWYGLTDEFDALHYAQRSADGEWTKPNDVIFIPLKGFTVRNGNVVTSDGMLHEVYRSGGAHYYTHAYSSDAYNAGGWSEPFRLDDEAYYLSLTATSDDVLHVVYGEMLGDVTKVEVNPDLAECFKCADVLYRRSTDGGKSWSTPVNLSKTPNGSIKMDIFQGPTGRLFVDWDEAPDPIMGGGKYKDVRIMYSDDEGLTWSDPIILDGGDRMVPAQIAATELNDGSLLAVWRDRNSNGIYFQTSDDVGKTWTDPEPVPGLLARDVNDTPYDDYNLVLDKLGAAHLFVAGYTKPDYEVEAGLYHIEYRQGEWRQLQLIYQGPQANRSRPEWPKAVIGPQNDIHLSWFIRFDETPQNAPQTGQPQYDTPGLAIYYSHRSPTLLDAPMLAFNPTQSPPTQVAYVAPLDPTPTPYPTVEPLESGFKTATSDLYATRILFAGIFAVAILCIAVVLFSGFRLRRP